MMCCTVGWPGPALAPVAGRRTVLELDITAAAAAPAGQKHTDQGPNTLQQTSGGDKDKQTFPEA